METDMTEEFRKTAKLRIFNSARQFGHRVIPENITFSQIGRESDSTLGDIETYEGHCAHCEAEWIISISKRNPGGVFIRQPIAGCQHKQKS